ncbi:MAG: hypothetical protein F6J93_08950 [Oscillatoria sp. SIO1A7]|nr:hypothetical protein [Oscillatoria sp. SIO1A7]
MRNRVSGYERNPDFTRLLPGYNDSVHQTDVNGLLQNYLNPVTLEVSDIYRDIEEKFMYVAEHTSKVLTLKPEKGILLSNVPMLLIALALFFLGPVTIAAFAKVTTLKCDRPEPERVICELTSSGFVSENVTLIEDLQGAKIQSSTDSDGDTSYKIVLIANNNKIIPFNNVSSIGGTTDSMNENVDKINFFINNVAETSLTAREDDRFIVSLFASFFMLLGGVPLLFLTLRKTLRSCSFDKNYGQVILKRKNLLSQGKNIDERLDNIRKAVAHHEGVIVNGNKLYKVKLSRKVGEPIFLYSSIDPNEITKTINQFLEDE